MRSAYFLLFTLLFLLPAVWAQTDDVYASAIKAYQENRYAEARDLFLAAERQGLSSGSLYYNLGNTYYALQEIGSTILYYERALKAEPHNPVFRQNLLQAKSRCKDDFLIIEDFFMWRWLKSASQYLSSAVWMWWSFLLTSLMAIWLMAYWWQRISKRIFLLAGSLILAAWICVVVLGWVRHYLDKHIHEGVIITPEVTLRAAPDQQSAEVERLHAGLKVTLIDTLSGWYKVVLPNKETGWINGTELSKI